MKSTKTLHKSKKIKCKYEKKLSYRGEHYGELYDYWECPICKKEGYFSILCNDIKKISKMINKHYGY